MDLLGLPTRPTPPVTWALRGAAFLVLGGAIVVWMYPEPEDSPALAMFVLFGLFLVLVGIGLLVVATVKALREPTP